MAKYTLMWVKYCLAECEELVGNLLLEVERSVTDKCLRFLNSFFAKFIQIVWLFDQYELYLQVFYIIVDFFIGFTKTWLVFTWVAFFNLKVHAVYYVFTLFAEEWDIIICQIRAKYIKIIVIRDPKVVYLFTFFVISEILGKAPSGRVVLVRNFANIPVFVHLVKGNVNIALQIWHLYSLILSLVKISKDP